MTSVRRMVLASTVALALPGCDAGTDLDSGAPRGGPATALNGGAEFALPWTLGPEPILQVGGLEAPADRVVLRAMSAFPLGDTAIAVADRGTNNVRVIRYDGSVSRVFGRAGDGPGEFRGLAAALPLGDSAIAVWDFDGSSTVFRVVDGSAETYSKPENKLRGVIDWVVPTPAQGLFVRGVPAEDALDPRSEFRALRFVGRRGAAAGDLDTLLVAPGPEVFKVAGWIDGVPSGADLMIAGGGDPFRLVALDTGTSSFRMWDEAGELVAQAIEVSQPERYTQVEWASVVEAALEDARFKGDEYRQALLELSADRVRPLYRQAFVDEFGWAWFLRRSATVGDPRGDPTGPESAWDVFDESGNWRGWFALPPRFRPLHIGGDLAIGAQKDELGVESVFVFQLQGSYLRD